VGGGGGGGPRYADDISSVAGALSRHPKASGAGGRVLDSNGAALLLAMAPNLSMHFSSAACIAVALANSIVARSKRIRRNEEKGVGNPQKEVAMSSQLEHPSNDMGVELLYFAHCVTIHRHSSCQKSSMTLYVYIKCRITILLITVITCLCLRYKINGYTKPNPYRTYHPSPLTSPPPVPVASNQTGQTPPYSTAQHPYQ
jgi:hypothetical protein